MAFVVIVHLSEHHESVLAEILQQSSAIPVMQVTERVPVEPNKVYVIPPAKHLEMVDGHIRLAERTKTMGRRVPVDLFFRTLAEAYGKDAFAVVLSGAGDDGTNGIERIKEEGGVTAAQDPDDADYDSMPRSAIATELVDVVLPAARLPAKLISIRDLEVELRDSTEEVIGREREAEHVADTLREVLTLVRLRTGHDFANYKRPTLLRRVARRLQVNGLTEMPAYVKLLREHPEEIQRLQRDLLITVTNFFRDKDAFVALERQVIPKLFEGKDGRDTVRVWSCGCGTGEEAYSLGILLLEHAAKLEDPPKLQIFASDIAEDAVRTAREGRYGSVITADVSSERLERFFMRKGENFCVTKELRDLVLFAPHNVLRDPPFSQLDLIVCRNMLIYLNRDMQERVMELFNFALRQNGHLFLGTSEAAETTEGLFIPVDKKQRIYRRLDHVRRRPPTGGPEIGRWEVKLPEPRMDGTEQSFSYGALHHRVVEQFAPPSVLVNEEHDICHMSERAGRFLHFTGGEPTRNLLKSVHPALQLDLRAALIAAAQENGPAEFRNIRLSINGEEMLINLIVRPVELPDTAAHHFLVLFDDERRTIEERETKAVYEAMAGDSALEAVVRRIEDELQRTKERLRLTIEHGEISNEELKASNEELQAINEELRSATEELETGKEELQSVNEELTTVNNELKDKVNEISDMNADLQNLMHSTDVGTIFLDRNLVIKRYTRKVERLFNIISSDVGRPLEHLTHRFDYDDLTNDAREVLEKLGTVERELKVRDDDRCYLARLSPYRTLEDHIDGVVITLVDITELKRATDRLCERDFLLRVAQEAATAGIWTLNLMDGTAWWSDECFILHGLEPRSVEMTVENWIVKMHSDDFNEVRAKIADAIENQTKYGYELKVSHKGGERWILEAGQAIYDGQGRATRLAGISLDVTDRINWQREQSEMLRRREADELSLREADRRKNEFLATLAHELRNPLAPIRTGLEVLRRLKNPEQMEAIAGMIERQVDQIVHLVDDLLDLSRITRGKIHLKRERMDLAEAVTGSLETMDGMLAEHRHEVEVDLPDEPLIVSCDRVRIGQVILNLVGNAAKFTKPGGKIRIEARREDDRAVLSVRDNGAGIEPVMLERIFDIFTQCGDARATGGLGIGLSLVKNLVSLHGGEIRAHSEGPGRGTEMIVKLPLAPGPPVGSRKNDGKQPPRTASARRVLLVDDNRDAADMLRTLLAEHHKTAVAYDGMSGLKLAEEFRPDAALLDIGLPDMSGCELAEKLRAKFPGMILIAISGWGQAEDRERTCQAGFDHHLVKPAQIERVLNLLGSPGGEEE